jgi:hypothetical protein
MPITTNKQGEEMTALLISALLFGAPADQFIIPDIGPVAIPVAAVRINNAEQVTPTDPPPPPPAPLSNCEEMHIYRVSAGLPAAFDALGWRESNCRNEDGVHTGCCVGYWMLWVSLHLQDPQLADAYHRCGVYSRYDVNSDTPGDKWRQACATKALYDQEGFAPWR